MLSSVPWNSSWVQFVLASIIAAMSVYVYNNSVGKGTNQKTIFGSVYGQISTVENMMVQEIRRVTHDSLVITVGFPVDKQNLCLGIPIGGHVVLNGPNMCKKRGVELWNGKPCPTSDSIARPYTPLSLDERKGCVELLIKVYPESPPEFPDGGLLGKYVSTLKVGDKVSLSGPRGRVEYLGSGSFRIGERKLSGKNLVLIMGGTGIAPGFQLIRHVLAHSNHSIPKMHLIFSNKKVEDILLKDELDELAEHYNEYLKVTHVLTRETKESYEEKVGRVSTTAESVTSASFDKGSLLSILPNQKVEFGKRINLEMIKSWVQEYDRRDVLILLCGPRGLVHETCIPALTGLGFSTAEHIVTF